MTGTAVTFGTLDWAIVALYFVANTAICIWCAMQKEKDTADYFLASRSAGWFLIGSSIFASNIGAEHLIGLAGSGADSGMAFAHWELHSYLVLVLGWVFAPFYLRANVFTTPEFLERRYTPGTRTLLSFIFLASYILTKASVTIFAGAFAIQTILGYETINLPLLGETDFFWFSAFFLVIITGVFVVLGGMKSVLWTEAMHVPVLLAGSAVLLFVGLDEIGGLGCAQRRESGNHPPVASAFDHARDAGLPGIPVRPQRTRPGSACCCARPSSGSGTGAPINTSCSACCTARGLKEARRGTIFAAYLKLAPVFIFLLPGMIAVALYKQGFPGFEGIGANPQSAFPVLVSNLLPVGLARSRARRHVVRAHERARVAVQFHGDVVHRGFLQTAAAAIERAAPRERRSHGHRRRHRARHVVDSVPAGPRQGPALHLPAARAVAARAVDRRRVHGSASSRAA